VAVFDGVLVVLATGDAVADVALARCLVVLANGCCGRRRSCSMFGGAC
jgi:hypothetical protein